MELKDVLYQRRSVRKFTEEPVSDADLDALLHAAQSGPSAVDHRPWFFYAVTAPDTLAQLRGASRFSRMESPLNIVVCGDMDRALPAQLADYWVQDCSAAVENILLQAVDLGLGAVWCGIYLQQAAMRNVAECLHLP